MALSCLTVYVIAFSCVTLLGRTDSTAAVQVDTTSRQNERRTSKVYFHNKTNASIDLRNGRKLAEKDWKEGPKVLQSEFLPPNLGKKENLSNDSKSYFALFDSVENKTRKVEVTSGQSFPASLNRKDFDELSRAETGRRKERRKVPNFVVWDVLQDSEREVRVHFNGITAKETVVKTGVDEETGKRQGLKLRQLTDGIHFIQLIYNFDDQIQDCEYIRQKNAIQKFLNSFREDVERAKATYEIDGGSDEEEQRHEDDYLEDDEGKIERYPLEEDSEQYEGEEDFGSEFRNVTFQIVRKEEELPGDLAEWMNYPSLKRKCRDNHKILKQLVYDKHHGDENAKKLAEEHIERVKRALDFSLIFPGTKWCGKSHIAEKYTALGGFSKTDKCCRTHDHCHPLITAFEEKYDFYNLRPYTISHCRCDLRRKRDISDVLLVPGTKWCGKGRRATKYTSLGGFSRTDKCCRVHDTMCPHWIGSLEKKYGLFNWRINTIMHCRCDKRFRACLKMAKTGTANFVGKLFFNVVQTKCFVLKPHEECSKYSWWGTCEKKEYRKKAYLRDNLSY